MTEIAAWSEHHLNIFEITWPVASEIWFRNGSLLLVDNFLKNANKIYIYSL